MKDTSDVIIELREILSQQIIPQVASKDSLNIILAQRPLRLPADIRTKHCPAPALKVDGKLRSNWFLAQYEKEAMHAIRFPYFCYVLEGEIDMRLGIPVRQGKARGVVHSYDILTLPAHSVLLIPPGVFFPDGSQFHWERAPQPPADSRLFWMHVLPTGALCHTCTTQKSFHTFSHFDTFVTDQQLAVLTEMLVEELQSSDTDIALGAPSALSLLLLRLRRGLSNSAPAAKGRAWESEKQKMVSKKSVSDAAAPAINSTILERACVYIQRQRGFPLDINDIANHAYVSPSYLAKLFRTELKTTVKKYVLEKRMERAASMLTNTEVSIQEIARYAGYMQPPQFNRVFKQFYHVTPTEFRRRNR